MLMNAGSDGKQELIFKSSPEARWKLHQLCLNGNICLSSNLSAEILKFENVYRRTDGRTPDRPVYYKLTLSLRLR